MNVANTVLLKDPAVAMHRSSRGWIKQVLSVITGRTAAQAAIVLADQAFLSIVNFVIGLALVYRSTPEQLGLYAFFQSSFYLLASIQNAVINTPMIVLSPRLTSDERRKFERGLLLGLMASGPVVALTMTLCLLLFRNADASIETSLALGASFVPLLLRDFLRTKEFARLQPSSALRRDCAYGLITTGLVTVLIAIGQVSAIAVFIAMALGASIAVAREIWMAMAAPITFSEVIAAYRQSGDFSRWSLLGATTSWSQSNSYVYVSFLILGARETAVLAITRMIMTPMAMLTQSWGNFLRPILSHRFAEDRTKSAKAVFYKGTAALLITLGVYMIAAVAILREAPPSILPAAYRDSMPFLFIWSAALALQILRSNLSSVLQALLQFRHLAIVTMWVACAAVAITFVATLRMGTHGSLVGIVAGEGILAAILYREVWRRLLRNSCRA